MSAVKTVNFLEDTFYSKEELAQNLLSKPYIDSKKVYEYIPKSVKEDVIIAIPGVLSYLRIKKERSIDNSFIYCTYWEWAKP